MQFQRLLPFMRFWPPFLGAGISAHRLADGAIEARLRLRWWNHNAVGSHYGGSLFSLCDPFFMIILLDVLGPGFVVLDKAATIRFRRPGRGVVRARFAIAPATVAAIRQQVERQGKAEPTFAVAVVDENGAVVAEVEKLLSVRRRDDSAAAPVRPAGGE